MSEDKFKNIFFLGLKRKPVQIFTLEDIQAMEQKTNDDYENSDAEMLIEDGNFNKIVLNQSLFIPIGNGQYILDYDKIQKNTNLILPKSFYENQNPNLYDNWSYSDFKNYFKEQNSNYYEN